MTAEPRCFCSAPLCVEGGLVVCTSASHIYALASAVPAETLEALRATSAE